ncbi:MAG: hypothetical protein WDN76_03815 [Alphaproteobacteria bacterium]
MRTSNLNAELNKLRRGYLDIAAELVSVRFETALRKAAAEEALSGQALQLEAANAYAARRGVVLQVEYAR